MTVIGIDPGPVQSAYVRWDGSRVLFHGIEPNAALRVLLRSTVTEVAVFEQVESFGMAVGADVFETVFETGRMYEIVNCPCPAPPPASGQAPPVRVEPREGCQHPAGADRSVRRRRREACGRRAQGKPGPALRRQKP